ncbi:dynein axonemal heavy chain 8 [Patella vulgata]|uniref:dynein axonemal heavy chain 8 n=1 Tax=Patella vulgata TaxID=6465 RepID=UPI0024A8CCB0|nr:dynein axonemal heavy chain 8 [Patella vulgata]
MKIFRDVKAVTQLTEFGRIVRIYNRLATALVTFESLWFTQWKNRIDMAKSGLRATLFVHHPVTNKIVVNSDERVLELIHEAKWLTRLEIQIPDSAMGIMQQEERFKSYKGHLELVLNEYKTVCESIPESLRDLFTPHIENVQQQLQPGLSTLAWNSMNIDAFLHQIHTATSKLKNIQEKVNDLMKNKVIGVIDIINNFCLYDNRLAFSQTWSPVEFREEMLESIKERSQQLHHNVATVVEGLQNVANLLSTKKGENNKKDKKMLLIVDEEEVQREKQKALLEESLVFRLIAFYRDQVFEAVLNAASRSLATLADASGCTGEIVRALSPGSEFSSECSTPRPYSRHETPYSRGGSAVSERPKSGMSALSNMTWSGDSTIAEVTNLQFEIQVKFSIPNIIVEPQLDVVQKAITDISTAIIEANKDITWLGIDGEEDFYPLITSDETIEQLKLQLACVIDEVDSHVNKHLFHFSYYNFLWKDDMHGNFSEFINADPGIRAIKREVERFLSIEKKVLGIPTLLPVGPVCLYTDPIKDALHGFAMAWKTKFATVLHEEAKKKLDNAVSYRENVRKRLEQYVQSLDQLNSSLHLLEDLRDMENKIDGIYLPIETMYSKLREFELRLPRHEVEEVDELREKWQELIELADQVREVLLKERRGAFEQELDKQVKTFVVEVIQFRNAFDAQGPSVPGIPPGEAVSRLQDFQGRYTMYDAKRKTLDSVSKLFGIPCKPFLELDKTGEELDLLSQLYGLFQKFIRFDNRFRDTLWADVDLEAASMEVETYWDECLALPSKLKDWDAYNDLKTKLQTYLEVFPLLHKLASKEIRNRHWLQVMQVTGSSFQLEANVFKLCHLLDIELIKYKTEIEEICRGASRELELEIKMRLTEEEWTEQVLNFEHYKKRGPMYLDKIFTERLLEQLEDAQALLASMLTSRYIGPLRDEAASWAEKLKEVAEVLELWLEVQDVWQYLEAVFSNSLAVKELPQEAKRFARNDKTWTKMMKRAFDTRNVLQCCYGGEVPRGVVLRHMHEELEICFKSLVGYLDNKRKAFPRFYFVSDSILLSILSRPNDLESVRPHLRSIFSQIHDVKLEKSTDGDDEELSSGRRPHTPGGSSPHDRTRTSSVISPLSNRTNTPPKIDKRLAQVHSLNPASLQNIPTMLPSEGLVDDVTVMDAKAVHSADGEILILQDEVKLTDGVECWLYKLKESVGKSLHEMNLSVIHDCNNSIVMDEWASKYPAQVCRMGMLYHWTKECEQGISDIKYDRKALQGTLRKYVTHTSKLSTVLSRGAWKTIDEVMLPVHKGRLECMVSVSSDQNI